MLKKVYRVLVFFPLLFLGCFLILLSNWYFKLNRFPNEIDEAGSIGNEWLISATIYLWIISIILGLISLGILAYRKFYLKEEVSGKILTLNILTVGLVISMYVFNIGYSLSWLFG